MKDVVGYEDLFTITEDGKLWSKRTKRFLKQNVSKTGYWQVATKIGGRGGTNKCFKIHRLVCEAYHENSENKPYVNHKDGDKLNNNISNLEWCTQSENVKHAYDSGLCKDQSGVNNSQSKLSSSDIEYIKNLYVPKSKLYGCRVLAKQFNVSHRTISDIINGKTYK